MIPGCFAHSLILSIDSGGLSSCVVTSMCNFGRSFEFSAGHPRPNTKNARAYGSIVLRGEGFSVQMTPAAIPVTGRAARGTCGSMSRSQPTKQFSAYLPSEDRDTSCMLWSIRELARDRCHRYILTLRAW